MIHVPYTNFCFCRPLRNSAQLKALYNNLHRGLDVLARNLPDFAQPHKAQFSICLETAGKAIHTGAAAVAAAAAAALKTSVNSQDQIPFSSSSSQAWARYGSLECIHMCMLCMCCAAAVMLASTI